jgi:hypothetical protein
MIVGVALSLQPRSHHPVRKACYGDGELLQTPSVLAATPTQTATVRWTRQWLSEGTIRDRVPESLGQLSVHNRAKAVQLARENGWQ